MLNNTMMFPNQFNFNFNPFQKRPPTFWEKEIERYEKEQRGGEKLPRYGSLDKWEKRRERDGLPGSKNDESSADLSLIHI